jgi:hypothetical protein
VIHRWGAGWVAFVTVLNKEEAITKTGKKEGKTIPSH